MEEHHVLERVISIAVYLFVNFVILMGIIKSKNNYKAIKRWLIAYVIIMCVLSYFFIPGESLDLTRLRAFIGERYSRMGFNEYLEVLGNTSTYVTHTYYYFVTRVGVIELLSVISCFINCSIITYVLYDYSKRHNIKGSAIAISLLFYVSIGVFMEIICGFRSMCAFSIFILCIYREFFRGKTILSNIILYVLTIGFHNAVVPIVLFRFLFLLFQKEDKTIRKVLNFVFFGLLVLFIIRFGGTIIEATTSKAQVYLDSSIYSYFWGYLSGVLTICIIAYVLHINKKTIKKTIPKSYYHMFIVFMILDSLFIFLDYSIFWRYSWVLTMLSMPIIMESFNNQAIEGGNYVMKKQNVLFYVLLFTLLLVQISRGDLCGLRFFF